MTVIGVDEWAYRPGYEKTPGGESYAGWDMDGLRKQVRARAAAFSDRALIYEMDTIAAADLVEDGSLDGVFIDADHTEAGVRCDIKAWRPKLRAGGLLAGHDIDWPTVRRVVQELAPDYRTATDNVWWATA